jgi:general secretion pathway protein F
MRRRLTLAGRGANNGARHVHAAIARLDGLLGGGLSTADALNVAVSVGGRESTLLARIARHVDRGLPFSAALQRCECGLSRADLALVEAGERSGDLSRAVGALRGRLDLRSRTRRRLGQVLLYPTALVATSIAVLAPMSQWVLPAFVGMYSEASVELPLATRTVMAAGNALAAHGLQLTGLVVAGVSGIALLRRRSTRARLALDRLLLSLPLVGRLARADGRANVYASLGVLLSAGIDVDEALTLVVPACENRALRTRFERIRPGVRRGLPLSAALERARVDRHGSDVAMLRTAEATGDYAGCLERLASAARLERDDLLERLMRAVEPMTIASMAVIVGATVLAVYQPVLGSASLLAGGIK